MKHGYGSFENDLEMKLALKKADHRNAHMRVNAVEVCGFGVPLPISNLNVARESKITTTPLV
jgi:hypothetical protein